MSKKSTKDVLTSPFLITVYAIILMIVFLFFKFKTNEGIIVNSFEEKINLLGVVVMIFSEERKNLI